MAIDSGIKDINDISIKEGDNITFLYNGNAVVAKVKYNNECFTVNCENNNPISCMLSDLKLHTSSFQIVV